MFFKQLIGNPQIVTTRIWMAIYSKKKHGQAKDRPEWHAERKANHKVTKEFGEKAFKDYEYLLDQYHNLNKCIKKLGPIILKEQNENDRKLYSKLIGDYQQRRMSVFNKLKKYVL